MRRSLAVIMLLALAGASAAAVRAIGQVERAGSPVGRPTVTETFSPNADGRRDSAQVRFELGGTHDAHVAIINVRGRTVARLRTTRRAHGPIAVSWNGHTDNGDLADEGRYRARITLDGLERTFTVQSPIVLDLTAPRIRSARVDLTRLSLGALRVHLHAPGATRREVLLDGQPLELRRMRRSAHDRASSSFVRLMLSVTVPRGFHARDLHRVRVVVYDAAGNSDEATPQLGAKA